MLFSRKLLAGVIAASWKVCLGYCMRRMHNCFIKWLTIRNTSYYLRKKFYPWNSAPLIVFLLCQDAYQNWMQIYCICNSAMFFFLFNGVWPLFIKRLLTYLLTYLNRVKSATVGARRDRQTDRQKDASNFIICPMLCYNSGRDKNTININITLAYYLSVSTVKTGLFLTINWSNNWLTQSRDCSKQPWRQCRQMSRHRLFPTHRRARLPVVLCNPIHCQPTSLSHLWFAQNQITSNLYSKVIMVAVPKQRRWNRDIKFPSHNASVDCWMVLMSCISIECRTCSVKDRVRSMLCYLDDIVISVTFVDEKITTSIMLRLYVIDVPDRTQKLEHFDSKTESYGPW